MGRGHARVAPGVPPKPRLCTHQSKRDSYRLVAAELMNCRLLSITQVAQASSSCSSSAVEASTHLLGGSRVRSVNVETRGE